MTEVILKAGVSGQTRPQSSSSSNGAIKQGDDVVTMYVVYLVLFKFAVYVVSVSVYTV